MLTKGYYTPQQRQTKFTPTVYRTQYRQEIPMPLTPLHLAAGLPLKKWISLKTFILVNIMIDIEPGLIMFFGMNQFAAALIGLAP